MDLGAVRQRACPVRPGRSRAGARGGQGQRLRPRRGAGCARRRGRCAVAGCRPRGRRRATAVTASTRPCCCCRSRPCRPRRGRHPLDHAGRLHRGRHRRAGQSGGIVRRQGPVVGPPQDRHGDAPSGMRSRRRPRGARIDASAELDLAGVCTHLAVADEPDNPYTGSQLAQFDAALGAPRRRPRPGHRARGQLGRRAPLSQRVTTSSASASPPTAPARTVGRCTGRGPALSLHGRG